MIDEQRGAGTPVSHRQVAYEQRPLLINHLAQFPATTVSFNLAQGASLGAAVTAIEEVERAIGFRTASVRRSRERPSRSAVILSNELLLLVAAVLVMYIRAGRAVESSSIR